MFRYQWSANFQWSANVSLGANAPATDHRPLTTKNRLLRRRQDHGHPIALDVEVGLGGAVAFDLLDQAVEDRLSQLHVGHFAAAEADAGLDLGAVLEEAYD